MDGIQAASMAMEADVLASQRGDQQAFTRLVETTCALVSSVALAIVRDPDLSRDITQDVFLSAWRDIGKLREPASFLPWLRQVTRHRAYHIQRSLRRGRRHSAGTTPDDLLEAVVDPRPNPQQRLVSLETRRLVAETIEALPVDAREVVTLYYREGRSVTQVADLLGLSDAAVRQRLARARASIREDLLERAGQEIGACAPGAAFVSAIASALTVAAPAASTAATLGMGSVKSGSVFAKIAAFVGGAAMGAAGGVAGVVVGLRPLRRQTLDDQERKALQRLQAVAVAVVVVAAFAMPLAKRLTHSDWAFVAVFIAFVVSLLMIYEIWLPRVLRRRFEAEMRADPVTTMRRWKRQRRLSLLAWIAAILIGATAVLISVLA